MTSRYTDPGHASMTAQVSHSVGSAVEWTRYPQSLPPEYNEAIGEVCARWAWLEFQLGVIARECLRLDKAAGFAITGGMSMRSVSTVLKALAHGGFPKGHPELAELVGSLGKKLHNIGDMRNEYAHSVWGYESQSNPDLGIFKFRDPESRIEQRWIRKPIAAIKADAGTLAALQADAQALTRALKTALHSR